MRHFRFRISGVLRYNKGGRSETMFLECSLPTMHLCRANMATKPLFVGTMRVSLNVVVWLRLVSHRTDRPLYAVAHEMHI
jgi:hypothetical protein